MAAALTDAVARRTALGLSQSEFARLLVVPAATLRNWEQNRYSCEPAVRILLRLIDHEPASRVTSYAYVNPLIAVVLGAVVAGERLAGLQVAGMALVLSGVVATVRARTRPA